MKNIAIIGSGSWGTALGIYLAKHGNNIKIWSYAKEEADLINNEKKCKFLPGIEIPQGVSCYLNYEEVITGSDLILHVTPSKVTREVFRGYKNYITNQPVIICSKGLELGTLCTLAEVLKEEKMDTTIGILSGPSHAEEVSLNIPTALVLASKEDELLKELQTLFSSETLRVYTSKDVKGVELGGALKNIIAFCAGIANSMELGDNSMAALITRGLAEIARLGIKMGAKPETFYGLSGLGDLIVTCSSKHSRNRKAGQLIGKGKTLEETKQEVGMVIESIDNIEVAHKLAKKYEVEMPIVEAVYDVLYNGLNPKEAVTMLMTRELKEEWVSEIKKAA